MKNLNYYLNKAREGKWAIGQFNFSDFTQVKGIVAVAEKSKSPVILGTSEGESKFFGIEEAVAIRNVLRKKTGLPIFLNLDHGKSFEYLKKAVDAGYDMVHFDGSKLSLEENIKISKEVVKYAKWRGALVEGEVGRIGTDSSKLYLEKFEIKEDDLSKPAEVEEYMEKTGVNLIALSIGNFHGIEISGVCPNLRIDILEKVEKEMGTKALVVLHGGSGTMEEDIKKAIKAGVIKININTELRLAFSGNLRRVLSADPEEIVPYKFLPVVQKSVEKLVEYKMGLFGSSGKI
ncbi:MAG: class II fructose-bisphosphate aldolase [Candidatus Staskawiczbacteria bacterium]|nr:class II fructose-bisphosphate aldolase [Candidatus Staskawiczbacteria bacterium]